MFHPVWVKQDGIKYRGDKHFLIHDSDGLDPKFVNLDEPFNSGKQHTAICCKRMSSYSLMITATRNNDPCNSPAVYASRVGQVKSTDATKL